MNVLFIDGDGPFGGASRSLYEAISAFPSDEVAPYFISVPGTALDLYKKIAIDYVEVKGLPRFDHTKYGFYRGLRWLILLREIFYIPFMVVSLLKARSKWKNIDFIHVNEFVFVFPGLLAKALFRVPLILHARALIHNDLSVLRTKLLKNILIKYVDKLIVIDGNVAKTIPDGVPYEIVNNSFSLEEKERDYSFEIKMSSLVRNKLRVGFVGNLHKSKGVKEIVEAAKILQDDNVNVDFIIVGGETAVHRGIKMKILELFGFQQNFKEEVVKFISDNNLDNSVHLLGPTFNIKYVYDNIDVLLFPSHFDAPGRPVFEAGFSGVPSIVAVEFPSNDTFIHKVTGLKIPGHNAKALAKAIMYCDANRNHLKKLGSCAKLLAQNNFVPIVNSMKLMSIYKKIMKGAEK